MRELTKERDTTYMGRKVPQLAIFDGIRTLMTLWILMYATVIGINAGAQMDPIRWVEIVMMLGFESIVSSNFAFDCFFCLAAFLASLKVLQVVRAHEGNSAGEMPKLILYRFLRLAPLYYFVFLFAGLVVPFIGAGPLWFVYERNFHTCD